MSIAENLRIIRERISRAAETAGRPAGGITIIAISKTFPPESISEAIGAGQRIFGENRVQEAESKLGFFEATPGIEWHLVGHLQSNKAKSAAELFHVVHSLDSVRLAARLNDACIALKKTLPVLIQVDLGKEETKHGISKEDVPDLIVAVSAMSGLRLNGLMTLPPYFEDPELARPFFCELRTLRDDLEREQPGCLGQEHLSMGMSHDYEVAIQEGATMVRIGTAIFGQRSYGE